jgi:hypothetical protein
MKCEEVEAVLIDYLDDKLDMAIREGIDKHLETCERCMDVARDFQDIFRTMSATEMEKPDETLRINFYHMLHSEMNKLKAEHERINNKPSNKLWPSLFFKIAAGIALLITGAFLGNIIHRSFTTKNSSELLDNRLIAENDRNKILMYTLLNEESPGERIKAVNFVEDNAAPDTKVLHALIYVLNNDNNVNVRLAAAYTLSKFLNSSLVRDSIVESLGKQTEPVIQVVLMNILTEKMEIKAVEPMKKIISDKNTMEQVKNVAEKSINVLL